MLDLIVRGGRVVTPGGVGVWDVAVQGEQIVAVTEPGVLTRDVGRIIDATGHVVIPGGSSLTRTPRCRCPTPASGTRVSGPRPRT